MIQKTPAVDRHKNTSPSLLRNRLDSTLDSLHHLPGLSFRGFLQFEGIDARNRLSISDVLYSHESIAPSLASRIQVLPLFKAYMDKGFYPFYRNMRHNDYHHRLQHIISIVIESDIPAVEKKIEYDTLLKAKRLAAIIAASLPYIPNVSTLAG